MTPETKAALEESIAHWGANVAAKTPESVSLGGGYCPLCALYYPNECRGCPVMRAKKKPYCEKTPYQTARQCFLVWRKNGFVDARDHWRKAAQAEVDFLNSLLPA